MKRLVSSFALAMMLVASLVSNASAAVVDFESVTPGLKSGDFLESFGVLLSVSSSAVPASSTTISVVENTTLIRPSGDRYLHWGHSSPVTSSQSTTLTIDFIDAVESFSVSALGAAPGIASFPAFTVSFFSGANLLTAFSEGIATTAGVGVRTFSHTTDVFNPITSVELQANYVHAATGFYTIPVDDFSITTFAVPTPAPLLLLMVGGALIGRRVYRRGAAFPLGQ